MPFIAFQKNLYDLLMIYTPKIKIFDVFLIIWSNTEIAVGTHKNAFQPINT